MKQKFIRVLNIIIIVTFCPFAQAGDVVEDIVNFRTFGLYNKEKQRRQRKLRERIEQQRIENQRRLDEEKQIAKEKNINSIETALENTKIQIKHLISYEDKVFEILNHLEGVVNKIGHDSNLLNEAKTISKEAHEAFNNYVNSIREVSFADQTSNEINQKLELLRRISEDENLSLIELVESALKKMGKTELLLLASSLQESISFINEMIKSEYNQYHEYNKIFESQAGYTYKNEITIEMRDNRYVLISEITVHERYKRPTPPPPTPPPTPPPPERVERPFRHNSFMY